MSARCEGEEAAPKNHSQHMRVQTRAFKPRRNGVALGVNIDPQKKARLRRLAAARGVTLTEAVDAALTAYVTGRPPVYRPNPRSRLVAAAVESLALLINRLDVLTAPYPAVPETLLARFEEMFVSGAYQKLRTDLVGIGVLLDRLAPLAVGPAAGPDAGNEDPNPAGHAGEIRSEGGIK